MPKSKTKFFFLLALVAIIFAGGFFRLWQLETTPPGLQYDEAYNGLDGLKAVETSNYRAFYPDNNGREGLYINIVGYSLKIFGVNNFGVRFASALFGILTLIGFAFLAKEMKFSKLTVLLGVFMLAFSFWHLNFSRVVYRGIMAPFLLVWIFYFFHKGLAVVSKKREENEKKKNSKQTAEIIKDHPEKVTVIIGRRLLYFGIAGALTGLGFHTYISFRVAPLIFVILASFLIFLSWKRFLGSYWRSIIVFVLTAFMLASPLFVYFARNPADFTGRSNAVSVFNSPDMSFPAALGKSLLWHLGAFFVHGDPNQRHNHNEMPLLPFAWSILFGLGFVFSLREIILTVRNKIKKKEDENGGFQTKFFKASLLGQSIFWVMLIPGVLSIEGIPHALRIIGVIPGVFIIMLIPIEYFLILFEKVRLSNRRKLKPHRWSAVKLAFSGMVFVIIASGLFQVATYFETWKNDPRTAEAFERELFDLGKLVQNLETEENNFIVVAPEIAISEDHKEFSLKTTTFAGQPRIKNYSFYRPLDSIKEIPCENSLIVFQKSDEWLQKQFQEKCPEKTFEKILPPKGAHSFWVMR